MDEKQYMIEVGQRIKDRRIDLGLTQMDIAVQLGMTDTGYANYEKGKRYLKRATLEQIAEILHVEPGYLAGWSDKNGKIIYGEEQDKVEEELRRASREKLMHYMTIIMEELKKRG